MKEASATLEREKRCRMDIIREAAAGQCVQGCEGMWLKSADMILYLTSLHPYLIPQNILTFMLTFLAISVQLYSPEMNCVLIF